MSVTYADHTDLWLKSILLAPSKVTNDKDISHYWKEKQVSSLNSLKFAGDKDKVVSNSRYGQSTLTKRKNTLELKLLAWLKHNEEKTCKNQHGCSFLSLDPLYSASVPIESRDHIFFECSFT